MPWLPKAGRRTRARLDLYTGGEVWRGGCMGRQQFRPNECPCRPEQRGGHRRRFGTRHGVAGRRHGGGVGGQLGRPDQCACRAELRYGDRGGGLSQPCSQVGRRSSGWGAVEPGNPSDPFGFGQSTVPAGLNGVIAIAAGSWNSVAPIGPPRLAPLQPQMDGSMELLLSGIPGWSYTIVASTNLADWTPLGSFVATNSPAPLLRQARDAACLRAMGAQGQGGGLRRTPGAS